MAKIVEKKIKAVSDGIISTGMIAYNDSINKLIEGIKNGKCTPNYVDNALKDELSYFIDLYNIDGSLALVTTFSTDKRYFTNNKEVFNKYLNAEQVSELEKKIENELTYCLLQSTDVDLLQKIKNKTTGIKGLINCDSKLILECLPTEDEEY